MPKTKIPVKAAKPKVTKTAKATKKTPKAKTLKASKKKTAEPVLAETGASAQVRRGL